MSDGTTILPFDFQNSSSRIIKVIGVGGGGGNAVNHMYKEGIHDVTFVVCNTDNQALQNSPVPIKLQLGKEGLGAGNKPEVAKKAAEESIEEIKGMLNDGSCRMAFITAGMGGGTGTGAAPVIANVAKELDILTVGIVTIPFVFEGNAKIDQALSGVKEMSKHVDALLVINNERLRDVYPDKSVMAGFGMADNILSVAAKSIAEIITLRGIINLDFNDVRTVLKDGGVAIMSTGYGQGDGRVSQAINSALNSPLLNNKEIYHSRKVLFVITYNPESELMMNEMDEIHEFMSRFDKEFETKWGLYTDTTLGENVKFTILATGFGIQDVADKVSIDRWRTQEEQKRQKEKEEEERKKEEERERYYGNNTSRFGTKRRSYNSYIFTGEDLDKDEIISMVENTPTYMRSKQTLDEIHLKATGNEEAPAKQENSEEPMTISF